MEKNEVLKPAIKSTPFESTNIASKIKNIKGKIRMPIRNVTFVQPLNDVTTTNLTLNGEFGKEGSANIGNPNSDNDVGVKRAELQQSVNSTMPTSRSSQVDSFANVVQHKVVKKVVQVKELRNSETVNGAAVAIPLDVVEEVSSRFANTLYGYFIGFSIEGMESVMEHGPWLIRRMPLMLNIWTPNTVLKKEEVKHAPLWVKLHHIPIVAYSEVGLSLISTQLGKPIMMDSYTSNMCLSSWGRSTYARILIEVSAENELMESLVIAIPLSNGKGHTLATIKVEYEWQPPRCAQCLIFDHVNDQCPKNPKVKVVAKENDDGFTEVKRKKNKVKQNVKPRQVDGVRLKQKKDEAEQLGRKEKGVDEPKTVFNSSSNKMTLKNSFSMLDNNETDWEGDETKQSVINESDSDESVEELIMEESHTNSSLMGASTPDLGVTHD
ncbi:reverse transcriptase domain, reverse transcriptase zinc-binding domain protein [Tanacetum coccineum]